MKSFLAEGSRSVFGVACCVCLLSVAAGPAEAGSSDRDDGPARVRVAGLDWHTDYAAARREAERCDRMLLVNFMPESDRRVQQDLEAHLADDASLQRSLERLVLVRLRRDAVDDSEHRLIESDTFRHLRGRAGIAMLDFRQPQRSYYGDVVTALPFGDGKYYRWRNSHLKVALGLPPGTINQRTMVWAVRIHPEGPESTVGRQHPVLVSAASEHSAYQARRGVQGHQRFETRYHQVRARADAQRASEVVAESWPNQDLIDSCLDCVRCWRHSPGHWRAVRKRHRLFGYDIRRGRNGIWYGTGLFAN